jgi:hypothetical protein
VRDSVASIELAVGGAVAILGVRTFSLFQAAAAVPEVHAEMVRALEGDDPELGRLVRRLGFRSPYAEVAGSLIRAAQSAKLDERRGVLTHACEHARAQVRRKFQRDQALDLVAIAVSIGLAAFTHSSLSDTPWFWPLAAALVLVLVLGLVARFILRSRIDGSLEQLAENIARRPSVPARAPLRTSRCPTCGNTLLRGTVTLKLARGEEPATALLCETCGYVQATRTGTAPVVS